VVALRDDVQEVRDERADDVEDEERRRQAPLVVRDIGKSRHTTALRRPAVFRRVSPNHQFWYPTRGQDERAKERVPIARER
jgi:hypothetical protein